VKKQPRTKQPTTDVVLGYLAGTEPPCVSLYQPTHRSNPDNLQDSIRFKNLVRDIENSLKEKYPTREVRELIAAFRDLQDDYQFWTHQLDGLAVLASAGRFDVYVEVGADVDPELWLADRERRQREVLQTLRAMPGLDRERGLAALRRLAEALERSPQPDHRAYQQRLTAYNCEFAARLHNAATPKQRQVMRGKLKGWEGDVRALLAGAAAVVAVSP